MTQKMKSRMVFLASSLAFSSFVLRPEVIGASVEPGAISAVGIQQRGPREKGQHPRPDLKAAAEKLGVTEQELRDALGDPRLGPPDLAQAAEKLGTTEEKLREALGVPGRGAEGSDRPRRDLKAAAKKLGIEESELRDALGDPSQGPPDLTAAAKKLGVSEDELREALGLPEHGGRPRQ